MKKTNSDSLLSRYSDSQPVRKSKNTGSHKVPLMAEYEQRYKGSGMSREITAPKPPMTLDEKIKNREKKAEPVKDPMEGRVSVEIAGNRYLLGCTDKISETRIKRIASLCNSILKDTKENNPGLTNSKITTLALIDACDRLITELDSNNNLKTELMYYQQIDALNKKEIKTEPTPMELLASEISEEMEEKKDDKKEDKKDKA